MFLDAIFLHSGATNEHPPPTTTTPPSLKARDGQGFLPFRRPPHHHPFPEFPRSKRETEGVFCFYSSANTFITRPFGSPSPSRAHDQASSLAVFSSVFMLLYASFDVCVRVTNAIK
jgi:hypothetical protein